MYARTRTWVSPPLLRPIVPFVASTPMPSASEGGTPGGTQAGLGWDDHVTSSVSAGRKSGGINR